MLARRHPPEPQGHRSGVPGVRREHHRDAQGPDRRPRTARPSRCSTTSRTRRPRRPRPGSSRPTCPRSASSPRSTGDQDDRRPPPRARPAGDRRDRGRRKPRVHVHSVSSTLTNEDITNLINSSLDTTFVTIGLTFIILLHHVRRVRRRDRPARPRDDGAARRRSGSSGCSARPSHPVSPYATQLIILIGLAVSVDYSLFMITRFRSERRRGPRQARRHRDRERDRRPGRVLQRARRDDLAGRAVHHRRVDLPVDGDRHDRRDLRRGRRQPDLPAGDARDPGRRRQPRPDPVLRAGARGGERPLGAARRRRHAPASAARASAARPAAARPRVAVRSISGSGSPTSPRSPTRSTASRRSSCSTRSGRRARPRTSRSRSPATTDPTTKAAVTAFETAARQIPGLSEPVRSRRPQDGKVALVSFTIAGAGQNDPREPGDRPRGPQRQRCPAAFGGLPGVQAYVTGNAAQALDVTRIYIDAIPPCSPSCSACRSCCCWSCSTRS